MPTGRERLLFTLLALLIALVQWWPMLRDPMATGFGDWQMIHHNWEAAFVSLWRFGEWPLWDPFHCGGVPILGNPESQLYAPWFWLSFLFGTVLAVKLSLLGHVMIALTGVYWLCRCSYRLRPPSAALGAVAWGCSGWFVWDGAGGHATFFPFVFAPWLSLFVQRRREPLREAAAVGALLVLTLFEGGTYPLPYFLLWLGFELGVRALRTRDLGGSVRFAAVSLGVLALCGAVRLLPIYLSLSAHPRAVPNDVALSVADVWSMLTARSHSWSVPGHPFVWAEYGSYVGFLVLALALIGAFGTLRRAGLQLLVGLGLWSSLMLGNLGPLSPFSLLHRLPVYDSLRVPSRFAVFVTFYLALLAAHGCELLLQRAPRPTLSRALGALLAAAVCVDLSTASWPAVRLWKEPPLSGEPSAEHFHLERRDYYRFYASYPRLNLGTPTCYVGGMNWPVSHALWLGPSAQLRLTRAAGRILSWTRSPNVLHADVELKQPARLVANQNFAPGYRSNIGTPIEDRGRLALDLPAGKHAIELRYRPKEFVPSAAISCAGIVVVAWLLLRRRSRHRPAV
jgi:hypothetical protein